MKTIFDYRFKDQNLLETAFTHSSYAQNRNCEANIVLAQLGDKVLGLVILELLVSKFGRVKKLTPQLDRLLLNRLLSIIAIREKFDRYLMTDSTKLTERMRATMLEAVIGAVYTDGGMINAKLVIEKLYERELSELSFGRRCNYKNMLLAYTRRNGLSLRYKRVSAKKGPHKVVKLYVDGELKSSASGSNKYKKLEEDAAEIVCRSFKLV